jgi:Undecaprenyl-phosphate glucose phosphotransferase
MQQNGNSRFLFLIDLLAIYSLFFIVFTYYEGSNSIPFSSNALMGLIGLIWFIISINIQICKVNRRSKVIEVIKNVFMAYSVLSTIVIAVVAIFGEFKPNDKLILYPLLYSYCFSTQFRIIYLIIIKHFIKNGYQQKSVLLIGGGLVAEKVMKEILTSPELGCRLHGILADKYNDSLPRGYYIGKLDRFSEVVRTGLIDEVIIALPLKSEETIIDMVDKCECEGIRARIVPDFFCIIRNKVVMQDLGGIPLIAIRTEPLGLLKNKILKRCCDIAISLTTLIILFPIFLIITVVIKATSKGPVLFKQERISANNKVFKMIKFRSMYIQDDQSSNSQHTSKNDKRITPVGQLLRKYSLDELPQFWNVFIGDMSVVGPRPELTYFAEKFESEISHYRVRHLVKSGITGLAQVNGWRGNTSKGKRIECDVHYIENWSLWLDLKIIWKTLFNRKTWQNAY